MSYSARDSDWVRRFYDDLVADINLFAENGLSPFLDRLRLQSDSAWNNSLLGGAAGSAIFVPILTPSYFESDYCQKELNAFLREAPSPRGRVMPAKLLSAAPLDHVLAKYPAVPFGSESPDGVPHPFRQGSPEYKEAIRKLSYAIAQGLRTIPPKRQGRPAVYLAPDFRPSSDRLRASLSHHFDVLPKDPASLPGLFYEELRTLLETDFARSFVSIHALNNAPSAKTLIDTQLDFAKAMGKPRLVWTPEPGAPRPDHLANDGFELFSSQSEIEERVRHIFETPAVLEPASEGPLVYFLCPDRAARTQAEPLVNALEERGVGIYTSPLEGSAIEALQSHTQALDKLDGCLIYYGDVGREWFDAVFLRIRKKIRQRQLPSAIFLAPPSTDHKMKDLVDFPEVALVHDADEAARAFLGDAE